MKNSKLYKESMGSQMFLALSNFAVLEAAISFVITCKELKIAQLALINQLFQLLNLIFAYGDAFYGSTCMLMSRN